MAQNPANNVSIGDVVAAAIDRKAAWGTGSFPMRRPSATAAAIVQAPFNRFPACSPLLFGSGALTRLILSAAAVGFLVIAAAPADAAQGCGRGFHRNHFGRCVPRHWHRHRFW